MSKRANPTDAHPTIPGEAQRALTDIARHVRRTLGDGAPLDAAVRASLERGLGADLSEVRLHTDAAADHLTAMLDADAFTVGADIYFRAGAYNTGSSAGLRLLAHELAHTVQQAGPRAGGSMPAVRVSLPGDAGERAAGLAANRVMSGRVADQPAARVSVRRLDAGEPMMIQRHGSWEHRLLGDAPSADLNTIANGQNPAQRTQLLTALSGYLEMWRNTPKVAADQITARYPYLRTVQLKRSRLIVTYGELNTLPDYLANPPSMDDLPEEILIPILQAVRQEGYYNVMRLLGKIVGDIKFAGAVATHLTNGTINDIWESLWLDNLTANLPPPGSPRQGTDSYLPLLARNACHFAPYSWYRWQQSYDIALQKAQEHHRTGSADAKREAWIYLGYADHFLQDSFAAGHLINKTLLMQWFIDWAAPQPLKLVPDWAQVQVMTAARQPGLAARGLYTPANPGGVRDPQTAEEQESFQQRMEMSGVRADSTVLPAIAQSVAYQNYLTFLNNGVIQAGALALHDDLNKTGLFVASRDHGSRFQLFGDGTMLNGGDGVAIAGDTAHMSQQSIQEVLDTGKTTITRDRIQSRFPTMAQTDNGEMLPLEQWHDHMRGRAATAFNTVQALVIGTLKPNIGRISMDQNRSFRIKLSADGRQGYFGWTGSAGMGWGWLVDKSSATKLTAVYDGGLCFRTDDNWWLSVGTTGVNEGYVGFYYHQNRGTWEYDAKTKRLKSGVNNSVMSLRGGNNYIYCWGDYVAADVEIEEIEPV